MSAPTVQAHACRTSGCTAPPTADHATLHNTSGAGLLKAYAALTHRIHVGEGRGSRRRPMTPAEVDDLRAQRDLIEAEVLRRMGEQA